MSTETTDAPAQIQVGGLRYLRSPRWRACPLLPGQAPPANAVCAWVEEGWAIVPADAAAPPQSALGPVYEPASGGSPAAPTGRVFVRFAEGQPAADQTDSFAAAGYRLESVPAWAPHAAWLRAADGTIGSALANLERLQGLAGIEHAEPQWLRPRAWKS